MKIIKPSVEIYFHLPQQVDESGCMSGLPFHPEAFLEQAGRLCYKSEDKITEDSASKFVTMLNKNRHHAMLEHCVASAKYVCDRGMTHELVRHRLASFAQESTRYCNYSKDKFDNAVGVIMPPFTTTDGRAETEWREAMMDAERHYLNMLEFGEPPQIARSVLPISLKTEIWITCNLREWMHVFNMRCAKTAHPQIRALMLETLKVFRVVVPAMFEPLAKTYIEEN